MVVFCSNYIMFLIMEKYFDFSLKGGSSMLVSGPTMAGKSTFVYNLVKDKSIFDKRPAAVYWYYGGKSIEGLEGRGYILRNGLPDNFIDVPRDSVVVLDDLMNEAKDHPGVTALFTKLVHHRNLFVINITQNFLTSVNKKATKKPHSYLFLDLRQETPEDYRVRSNLLQHEFPYINRENS